MELFTKSQDPDWDRTVYVKVHTDTGIPEEINEQGYYKLLLVREGSFLLEGNGIRQLVVAPALVLFPSLQEAPKFSSRKSLYTTTVFLKPTEIREEFTIERIQAGEFENAYGRTVYQDYLLVNSFLRDEGKGYGVLPLALGAYTKILKTIEKMENELKEQADGFWPCRSRSYMMELLYFIGFVCNENSAIVKLGEREASVIGPEQETVGVILQYLSEHMADKIALEDICKEFGLNRNRLNELFLKETSMTCLNYFTKMRVNLAQIMLAETELQIGEIAARVGYPDSNYFVKVFRKVTGVTPTKYRESFMQ